MPESRCKASKERMEKRAENFEDAKVKAAEKISQYNEGKDDDKKISTSELTPLEFMRCWNRRSSNLRWTGSKGLKAWRVAMNKK